MTRSFAVAILLSCVSIACATPTTAPSRPASDWGRASRGLQARIDAPLEVEQNDPLTIQFHLRAIPAELPKSVDRIDTFLFPAWTELMLKDIRTGKEFRVATYDPSLGMPVSDDGTHFVRLNGHAIEPRKIAFPLRSVGDALEPGAYDCTVSYSTDRIDRHWLARRPAEGFWSGEVRSGPLRLRVLPEKLRVRSVSVPNKLTLDPNLIVIFAPDDAREVKFPVRNGTFFGTRITRSDGPEELRSGLLAPGPANPVDDWGIRPPKAGRVTGRVTYTIELFETALPPQHFWAPAPGSNDYRTLWTGTFVVSGNK